MAALRLDCEELAAEHSNPVRIHHLHQGKLKQTAARDFLSVGHGG